MPFFLLIVFGLWSLLILANDNWKQIAKFNDFPPCLRQEEYLKFYELLLAYRKDSSRNDAVGDAKEDAGQWIYDKGYLPFAIRWAGRSDWLQRPLTRRNGFTQFAAHERPSYRELLLLRSEDIQTGDHSMRGSFLKHHGKDVAVDQQAWSAYCAKIDTWFVHINEQYNIEKYHIEQNRPTGYALEYLIACCKMFEPGTFNWERYHVRLGVLRCGFLPTSLKPWHGHKETRKCEHYIAKYPPDEMTLCLLLDRDRAAWLDSGHTDFEHYECKVRRLFSLAEATQHIQFDRTFNVYKSEGCLEQPDKTWHERDFKKLRW